MVRRYGFVHVLLCGFLYASTAHAQLAPGIAHLDAGRLADARAFFADYTKANPKDAGAVYYLGRVYFEQEKYEQAAKYFKKAVDLDGRSASALYFLGASYGTIAQNANVIKQASMAGKIKSAFERAVELDPDHLDARYALMQFYLMAPGFMGGSKEKAKQQADEIRQRDASRGTAALATYYLHQKDYAGAEKAYRDLIAAQPGEIGPYLSLARLLERQEHHEAGFTLLEQALAQTESPQAAYQIGRLGALTGLHLERAEEAMRSYLKHQPAANEPSLAWAHYRLGMVYEHQGKPDAARDAYATTLRLDAEHEAAIVALQRLR